MALRVTGPARHAGLAVLQGTAGLETRPELVHQADLVVLQRDFPRDTAGCAQVFQLARARGIPVVYDLDDLIFDLPSDHPDRAIFYYTAALAPMLEALVAADGVTASTPALCEVLRAYHPHVFHLPNYLIDDLWSLRPAPEPDPARPLTLGYMGGASHAPDLDAVTPVLQRLARDYRDRLRFHFWGGPPPAGLRSASHVRWTELDLRYPAFAAYMEAQTCDVFIAPLQDNLFNRCKSPVKFLEYSALGVPGVYSRVGPYAGAVTHSVDGFLAGSETEWEAALRALLDDPAARQAVGARAQETVRDRWRLSQHAGRWPETYAAIAALEPPAPDPARERAVAEQRQRFQDEVRAKQAAEAQVGSFRERIMNILGSLRGRAS